MPIKIYGYFADGKDVWRREQCGYHDARRLIAQCQTKVAATKIAKLLNADFEQRESKTGK